MLHRAMKWQGGGAPMRRLLSTSVTIAGLLTMSPAHGADPPVKALINAPLATAHDRTGSGSSASLRILERMAGIIPGAAPRRVKKNSI
jgi:hypothetical protein